MAWFCLTDQSYYSIRHKSCYPFQPYITAKCRYPYQTCSSVVYYKSVTFGLPILVLFMSNPCFIRRYPWFLLQNIFSIWRRWLSVFVALERAHGVQMRGGRGSGHKGGKNGSRIFVQNYSGVRFIVRTQGPMSGLSMAPSPAGDWGVELHGS